jgi:hypothetical protein
MAQFTKEILEDILGIHTNVRVAVETGTMQGNTTKILASVMQEVHTIELSKTLYNDVLLELSKYTNVICHLGDSRDIISGLYPDVPVLWYLDAHAVESQYGGLPQMADTFPLFDELRILRLRKTPDIIVVDDVHAFGRNSPGWRCVNTRSICNKITRIKESKTIGDQFVIYRKCAT